MTGYQKRLAEIAVYIYEIDFLLDLLFKDDETPKKIYKKQLKRKLWEATHEEDED